MRRLDCFTTRLVLVGFVAAIVLGGGSARADFTFGTPTNLGPTVNSSSIEGSPNISADGLSLYFTSNQPDGYGVWDMWITTRTTKDSPWREPVNIGPLVNGSSSWNQSSSISPNNLTLHFSSTRSGNWDIWVTTRETTDAPWSNPVKLGPIINSSSLDHSPSISADGLSLFFGSERPGGLGEPDIWVSTRATTDDPWGEPVNLGPNVNSPANEGVPSISADGRTLFLSSHANGPFQSGGYGSADIWFTRRATTDDDWGPLANLGPMVNSPASEIGPSISADGSTLYFSSDRPGGYGIGSLWQVSIEPIVDLNGDGFVDAADMCIIVDHWGEDYPLCDIGPMPWGDGVVDVEDLIVLSEHLFEEIPPVE